MTKQEIIEAVDAGRNVYWKTPMYKITKIRDDYYVKSTGHMLGLVTYDGDWNVNPDDCFISK
jgi:hypothetical protein